MALRRRTWLRRKYHNHPTGGYASKLEADYAAHLRTLQAGGAISNLREQVPYAIEPPGCKSIRYVADFVYDDPDGRPVVADTKGMITAEFRIKAKLFRARYPDLRFVLVRKIGGRWVESDA